jgi:cytochrome c oxidase assembly factor CtaG
MSDIQWWCASRGTALWTWEWQPYPGIWLFVALFALSYWRLARGTVGTQAVAQIGNAVSGGLSQGARSGCAVAGLLLLWLTLDWPAGALGAGYLAGVHSLQYVLLSMLIPALLLLGARDEFFSRFQHGPRPLGLLKALTNPPIAAIIFTLVMAVTHAPLVLDLLMQSQWGSFALDMAWLGSGIILAWPVICRVPERPHFGPPLQILYIFGGTVAHVFIGMWLLSAQYPVYATYELAARVGDISPLSDQHLAGAAILLVGSPLVLLAVTIIFFRWQGTGEEGDRV